MSWMVFLRARAEADLEQARSLYEANRPGLGDEFIHQVSRVIRGLAEDPERPPVYYRDFRRVLMRRFPYKFFYRVEKPRVIVFRVLHARRDHTRWLPK